MLFVHITLERKEWISCNDVSCIIYIYVSMCIVHNGMAYAIHIDIFIIMLLITCHNTWTELQPQCRCELMRNGWKCEWKWHIGKGMVLYLSTTGLAHTQKYNLQLLKFDDKHTTGAEHFNHCTLFRSSSLFLHCSLLLFYLFLCLSVSVSVSLSLSLSVSVSVCLSVCLSLSFFLSLCLSFSFSKRRTLACSVKGTHEVIEICTQTHSK